MAELILVDLIDSWLHGPAPALRWRFPTRLESRFEADTGRARSRTLLYFSAGMTVAAIVAYPALLTLCRDVEGQFRVFYLALLPTLLAVVVLMLLNPPPVLREAAFSAMTTLASCAGVLLFAQSHQVQEPTLLAAVMALMVYCTLGVQLRFPFALVGTLLMVLTCSVALHMRPDSGQANGAGLGLSAAVIGFILLLANRRLQRDQRRLYLHALRDRVQRTDISAPAVELEELTRRDPLTGLANRRGYDSWLATAWGQEAATQGRIGMVLIEVDRFRNYNDFYGHDAGDDCLKKIAVCLRDQLRTSTDQIARLSGAEFVVLLPGLSNELCADIAERLRLAVCRLELPHLGLGPRGLLTVSAGVASQKVVPNAAPSSLYQAADAALYQAKIFGRNRVCIATSGAEPIYGSAVSG